MGDVWLARDTLLDRDVALKFVTRTSSGEARLRFRVEARAVARLEHPNIVTVHHAGEVADHPFIVSELLRGSSLDRVERLPAERVVAVGADLARALAAAHAAGVIHRDVKPANAFLCDDGGVKLLDFGIAQLREGPPMFVSEETLPDSQSDRATASAGRSAGSDDGAEDDAGPLPDEADGAGGPCQAPGGRRTSGTPQYMAPETWRAEPCTRATDIYSLGALLYELLAGRPPYVGDTLEQLCVSVLAGHAPDLATAAPRASAQLVDLVMRCLTLRPEARPSAEEVCNALQSMLGSDDEGSGTESIDVRGTSPSSSRDPAASPYRGLLSFGTEHRALFFGREVETAAVITELHRAPFVLVVGSSGAGKSSLLRAGVLPRVLAGALGRGPWRAATMVPGERPIERLAQVLSPLLGEPEDQVAASLAAAPSWGAQRVADKAGRVLLVIDQLEEAWTLSAAPERAALLEALAAFARVGRDVRVVATLRADFLSRLKDLGELRTQALRAPVVLGPLSSEGLRRPIAEPARRRGVEMDRELVDQLVEAARGASGMLPLLEFALGALWERRDEAATGIAVADLEALGGLQGALASHADAALARLAPSLRAQARRLLLALVTVEGTRARREERDLLEGSADARLALDALVDARLVVASAGDESTAYEVAHEVLLSGWPALRGWLDEEAQAREALERVRRAAAEWERLGRGADGLFAERQLAELYVLQGRALPSVAVPFVAESRAAVRRARLRRARRSVWGRRSPSSSSRPARGG